MGAGSGLVPPPFPCSGALKCRVPIGLGVHHPSVAEPPSANWGPCGARPRAVPVAVTVVTDTGSSASDGGRGRRRSGSVLSGGGWEDDHLAVRRPRGGLGVDGGQLGQRLQLGDVHGFEVGDPRRASRRLGLVGTSVIDERSASPFGMGTALPMILEVAMTSMRGSDRCMMPTLLVQVPPTRRRRDRSSRITSPTEAPLAMVSRTPIGMRPVVQPNV